MYQCIDCKSVFDRKLPYCSKCSSTEIEITQAGKDFIEKQNVDKASQRESQMFDAELRAASLQGASEARQTFIEGWQKEIKEFEDKRLLAYKSDALNSIEMLSLPSHPTKKVIESLGLVKGVSDIQAGLFSLKSHQRIYEGAFEVARRELAVSTVALGGNAVVGIQSMVNSNVPSSSTLAGGSTKSVETIILFGTAVRLS